MLKQLNWKKIFITAFVIVILIISINVLSSLGINSPRDRDDYRQYDFANDRWLSRFEKSYQQAKDMGDAWIKDPIAVGLRVAGYPNEDQAEPEKVSVFYENSVYASESDAIIMVVFSDNLHDDSVSAKELRVDLIKKDGIWEIEWLGVRNRCKRTLYGGWTTGRCV